MNQRIFFTAVGACLVAVVAALLYLWPVPTVPDRPAAAPPPAPAASAVDAPAEAAAEARRARIEAAFDELATARKALQRKLGDLKTLTWGRELPVAQARRLSQDMMSAQYLLKNPPLLGAFSDVADVQAERARVNAALVRLEEIETELGASTAPQ